MATINQFKANLVGAGPRNNRFEVFIPRSGNKIQFLCKTASLPGQAIESQDIKYKGMTIKLAGDRTLKTGQSVSIMIQNFLLDQELNNGCKKLYH